MKLDINKYTYRTEWSEDDNAFLCRCLEFPSLAAHGDTPEEALEELKDAVETAIEWLTEDKEAIPEPFGLRKYKGNLTLRVSPQTHRLLAIQATEEGVSINQYITKLIESNTGYNKLEGKINELHQLIKNIEEQISLFQILNRSQKTSTGFEGTIAANFLTSWKGSQFVHRRLGLIAAVGADRQSKLGFVTDGESNLLDEVNQETECYE